MALGDPPGDLPHLGEPPPVALAAPHVVGQPSAPAHLRERIARALRDDVWSLSWRLILANRVAWLLPDSAFSRLRTLIYRLAGIQIGPKGLILGRLTFTGAPARPQRLHIGAGSILNGHCFIDLNAEIWIGDRVSIGHHVTFITADHEVGPAACRAGAIQPSPIIIEDGCWIGACCTLLPGAHIGKSCIVAAGSVVYGEVPPNRMVGGVPARSLKMLDSEP